MDFSVISVTSFRAERDRTGLRLRSVTGMDAARLPLWAGLPERKIGPADDLAPVTADFASFSSVPGITQRLAGGFGPRHASLSGVGYESVAWYLVRGRRITFMMRYAALLRGINVGGNKKIPMAALRELMQGLGYPDVVTHLQSGNAVFSSPEQPAPMLARVIAERITSEFAMDVKVVIRTGGELADVIKRSPLPDGPENRSRFFVAFLATAPSPKAIVALESLSFDPDRIWVSGAEAFLWCPAGAAETKLSNNFLEKRLGVTATMRNWNTVTKLAELTSA
jgi:uncharacterized protein (DUF1697 family)